ncbi:MAG: class I SAM-dependent methyltransferase [Geminicoccaceae bacterium]
MLGQLDNSLQRFFGLPYLFASRDFNIHSRCRYLLYKLARIEGKGLSVLDVGCGAGITLRHLATAPPGKIGRYVGIDLSAERLMPRYRDVEDIDVAFHNVDLDDPWDVGKFDVVWCSEVIEHLTDDAGQILKMKRAAKAGGMVLITTPCLDFVHRIGTLFPPILKTSAVQDGGHVRHGYRFEDMQRLAAEAGLVVDSIDGVNRLTLAETEKRYTTRRASWVMNNIRMSWRARDRQDFVIGEAFRAEPERYASIGAALVRPVEPIMMRPEPEAIAAPPLETMGTEAMRAEVVPSQA